MSHELPGFRIFSESDTWQCSVFRRKNKLRRILAESEQEVALFLLGKVRYYDISLCGLNIINLSLVFAFAGLNQYWPVSFYA